MLVKQVIPGQPGTAMARTALHLNPAYRGKYSKTGELDDIILVSRPWLCELLEKYLKSRPAGGRLWTFNLAQLRKEFLVAADRAGVAFLRPVLYMGRHSGASLDRLEERLSLAEVRKRGRWRCESSVARYEKRALVQEVFSRMSARARSVCQRCEARLLVDLRQRLSATKRT